MASSASGRLVGMIQRHPMKSIAAIFALPTSVIWLDMKMERYYSDKLDSDSEHLARIHEIPRSDWKDKIAQSGLQFGTLPGVSWGKAAVTVCGVLPTSAAQALGFQDPYWNESASYRVSAEGMWRIEKASYDLHSMILEAVEEVIQSDFLLESFGIPTVLWPEVRRSWENRESDLMGRFDFLWDGKGDPKLAEYNADTPTVLVESAAAQKDWLKEKRPNKGQFNTLDEALKRAWRTIALEEDRNSTGDTATTLTLAAQGVGYWNQHRADANNTSWTKKCFGWIMDDTPAFQEEAMNGIYLHNLAKEATSDLDFIDTKLVDFDELQASDLANSDKGPLWKLYPWEWLVSEEIGAGFSFPDNRRHVLEPPWKLVASSKVMLAYLWRKHPNHPNLLPSACADELVAVPLGAMNEPAANWVAKPSLGREGVGLTYGDEVPDVNTLQEFAKAALEAGEVLTMPRPPPPPPPPSTSADIQKDLEIWKKQYYNNLSYTPIRRLLDRGPIHKKSFKHKLEIPLGPTVVQQYYDVASMHGRKVITSAWVVRGMPVAACFREDNAKTTNNNSCFVPHWIEEHTSSKPNVVPRILRGTENQNRIRTELYGMAQAFPAQYGDEIQKDEDPPAGQRGAYVRSGGGGAYGPHRLHEVEARHWFWEKYFGSRDDKNNEKNRQTAKKNAKENAMKQERERKAAMAASTRDRVQAPVKVRVARERAQARAERARAYERARSRPRTGSHGHGTSGRWGRWGGYAG